MTTTAKEQQIHHLSYNNKSRLNESEEHLYEAIDLAPSSSANLRRIMLNQTDKKGYKTKSDDLSFPTSCIKSGQVMAKQSSFGEKTDVNVMKLGEEEQERKTDNLILNPVKEILTNEANKEVEFCLRSCIKGKEKNAKRLSNYVSMDSDDNTFNTYGELQQGFYKCHKNLSDINDFDIVPDFRYRDSKKSCLSSDFILKESMILRESKLSQMISRRHLLVKNSKGDSRINLNNPQETSKIFCSKCNMTVSSNFSSSSTPSCTNFCCFNKNIREGIRSDDENSIVVANFVQTMNKYQPRRQKSNHISSSSTKESTQYVAKNYYKTGSATTLSFSKDSGNSSMSECAPKAQDNNSVSTTNDFTLLNANKYYRRGDLTPPLCSMSNSLSNHHFKDNVKPSKCHTILPMPPSHEPHHSCHAFSGMDSLLSSSIKKLKTEKIENSSSFTGQISKIKNDTAVDSRILHTLKSDNQSTNAQSRSQFHGAQTHLNIQHSSNYSRSKEHEDRCLSKLVNKNHDGFHLNNEEIRNNSVNNKLQHNMLKLPRATHILNTFSTSPTLSPPPLPPKPKPSLISVSQNCGKVQTGNDDTKNENEKFDDVKSLDIKLNAFMAQNKTCFPLSLPQHSENARQTSNLCQLEDDGVKEITNNKNKKDKTFIAYNREELAQSVQALQKLSYDLLGLIDGQQKSHLRHGKESNFPRMLEERHNDAQENEEHRKLFETKQNHLQIIRKNTKVADWKVNEYKVTKSIRGQSIQENSSSSQNEQFTPNKEALDSKKELSCKTNMVCDDMKVLNNQKANEVESSKDDDKYVLNFLDDKLPLSNCVSSANEELDLSFNSNNVAGKEKDLTYFNANDTNHEVDSRRKLVFSPPSPFKLSCVKNVLSMNETNVVNAPHIKERNQNLSPPKQSLKPKKSVELPIKVHKKNIRGGTEKERLRLTSSDRIGRRKENYKANKRYKSSKLGHISFMESLRSTSKIESPITNIIKKRMASSAVSGNTAFIPSVNDTEKTFFNHSSEDFKSYSVKKGDDSADCTPISSFKSAHFHSLYSPNSTPFTFRFRRRNSTPLKGHKCRKENFNMLKNDYSNKSLKQKINGKSLLQSRLDVLTPNRFKKTTTFKEQKILKQNNLQCTTTHHSSHQSNKEKDKDSNSLSFDGDNKENQINTRDCATRFNDSISCNLPIIPFNHSSYNLSSTLSPSTALSARTTPNVPKKGSFDTYIEMTPKRCSELRHVNLQKLACQSRQSFLLLHKNIPTFPSSNDCNLLSNDSISAHNKIVRNVTEENQCKERNLRFCKNSKFLATNNIVSNSMLRSSHNNYYINQSNNQIVPPDNHFQSNETPLHNVNSQSKDEYMSNSNCKEIQMKYPSTIKRLNRKCSQPHDHDRYNVVIKDENQNQQSTCIIDSNKHCHHTKETLHDEISSNSRKEEKLEQEDKSQTTIIIPHHPRFSQQQRDDEKTKCVLNGKEMDSRNVPEYNLKANSPINGMKDDSSTKIYLNIDDYVKMGNVTNFCF